MNTNFFWRILLLPFLSLSLCFSLALGGCAAGESIGDTDLVSDVEFDPDSSDPGCGDGIVQQDLDEECDEGEDNNDQGFCTNACLVAFCGDGLIQAGAESCDEGGNNGLLDAGCTLECEPKECGDGIVQPGEACDDGNENDDDGCTTACLLPSCGDGIVQPGEDCDDGNHKNRDGCTECALDCGNGLQENHEPCDDGNDVDDDQCTNSCELPTCGDGIRQAGEECDFLDESEEALDGCTPLCLAPRCGDGFIHEGVEQCDPGSQQTDTPGCIGPDTNWVSQELFCRDGQLIFVTDTYYKIAPVHEPQVGIDYNFFRGRSGLNSADTRCQERAEKAGLSGEYRAWLSVNAPDGSATEHVGLNADDLLLVAYFGRDVQEGIDSSLTVMSDHWSPTYGISLIDDDFHFERPVKGVYGKDKAVLASWSSTDARGEFYSSGDAVGDCSQWSDPSAGNVHLGRPGIASQWTIGASNPMTVTCK